MGPQSSGKSTLLNHLFGTNFMEMDAVTGRSQTTKGIWIADCAGINPCTLVMDLEGSDGRERGEDDTTFEKQSALFALAVSDIVLINIWCNEIGRERAANKPLLRTVFQVMMRLFTPRKTTLIFVIRDKSRTPFETLESDLREDTEKIWKALPKTPAHKNTPLSDFFNIKVVALSHYELAEKEFKEQVANLRQQFFHSIAPGGLAGDRRSVVPASGFSISAQHIWKVIKENKDLDLPAHKVMVAGFRCEEIANERCSNFTHNPDWLHLEEASQSGPVPDFGRKLSSILGSCFSEYDAEAVYFDEGVRTLKRKYLEDKLLQLIEPAFHSMMGHLRSGALRKFKEAFQKALNAGERLSDAAYRCQQSVVDVFDKGCADSVVEQANWDVYKVRSKLFCDLTEHITSIRASKLGELTPYYKTKLNEALSRPVEALLEYPNDETWPSIRELLNFETQLVVCRLASDLSSFDLDEQTTNNMLVKIAEYGRGVVEEKAREAVGKVLFLMKERFISLLQSGQESQGWTNKDDIITTANFARSMSLKVLSVMSAIRLDDEADHIYNSLIYALLENSTCQWSLTLMASSTWEMVPSSQTLITPAQCRSLWKQFDMETEYMVHQATFALDEAIRHNAEANRPKKRNWRWVPAAASVALSAVSFIVGAPTG